MGEGARIFNPAGPVETDFYFVSRNERGGLSIGGDCAKPCRSVVPVVEEVKLLGTEESDGDKAV